jgi:hypothetical protein
MGLSFFSLLCHGSTFGTNLTCPFAGAVSRGATSAAQDLAPKACRDAYPASYPRPPASCRQKKVAAEKTEVRSQNPEEGGCCILSSGS